MTKPRILAFAGSLRRESFNMKLARAAARAAEDAGVPVTILDLREYPLPIYDQDLEQGSGAPDEVQALKRLFLEHAGFLIASPEHNSSISAALKNVIDWVSRPADGEPPLAAFRGKAAALLAASPGALGGLRGLVHIRSILGNLGVILSPNQYAMGAAHMAFDEDGSLRDERARSAVDSVGRDLADLVKRLA